MIKKILISVMVDKISKVFFPTQSNKSTMPQASLLKRFTQYRFQMKSLNKFHDRNSINSRNFGKSHKSVLAKGEKRNKPNLIFNTFHHFGYWSYYYTFQEYIFAYYWSYYYTFILDIIHICYGHYTIWDMTSLTCHPCTHIHFHQW